MEPNRVSGRNVIGKSCTDKYTFTGKEKNAITLSTLKGWYNIYEFLTRVNPNFFILRNVRSKIKASSKLGLIIGIYDVWIGFVVV
jgi:hypothetical protein